MPNLISFNVQIYGKLEPYSPTLSKTRVRIFYRGFNRNSTYITEEFAEKLLSTLPYAPVKGIYSQDNKDFTDHGKARTEGKIYGVSMENPNVSWEDHLDEDGVTRTYACGDALLFTGLYPEAAEIPGKPQSMEMFLETLKGDWQYIEGKRVFVYTDGCFLGLQALGDTVKPCFEGAEFFSLYNNLKNLIDNLEGEKMLINFKLSDSTKHDLLFNLINSNYTEEKNWEIDYGICDVYDDYALCYSYADQCFYRFSYQKDDDKNEVTLSGEPVKCFILDVTESEYQALNLLKAANEGNFNKIDEVYTAASEKINTLTKDLESKTTEFDSKVLELETANATLTEKETELVTLQEVQQTSLASLSEKENKISELTGELSTLKTYRDNVEISQKTAVIQNYQKILDADVITTFTEKMNEYTVIELKKELAFLASEQNPSIFSKAPASEDPNYIPTGSEKVSGATRLLMKHKK